MTPPIPDRRSLLLAAAALLTLPAASRTAAEAAGPPLLTVHRDPSCGCCMAWVAHAREAGFRAEVIEAADLGAVKARLGVPPGLAACHTAEVGGYVVEGHVPAGAITRLLAERPAARGLAVPGMPAGSPGMAVPGLDPETYEVILFGPEGERVFARYRGDREA